MRSSAPAASTPIITHYDVLGLSSKATHEEIKEKSKEVMLKWFPDKAKTWCPPELNAHENKVYLRMHLACEVLRKPSEKMKYDHSRKERIPDDETFLVLKETLDKFYESYIKKQTDPASLLASLQDQSVKMAAQLTHALKVLHEGQKGAQENAELKSQVESLTAKLRDLEADKAIRDDENTRLVINNRDLKATQVEQTAIIAKQENELQQLRSELASLKKNDSKAEPVRHPASALRTSQIGAFKQQTPVTIIGDKLTPTGLKCVVLKTINTIHRNEGKAFHGVSLIFDKKLAENFVEALKTKLGKDHPHAVRLTFSFMNQLREVIDTTNYVAYDVDFCLNTEAERLFCKNHDLQGLLLLDELEKTVDLKGIEKRIYDSSLEQFSEFTPSIAIKKIKPKPEGLKCVVQIAADYYASKRGKSFNDLTLIFETAAQAKEFRTTFSGLCLSHSSQLISQYNKSRKIDKYTNDDTFVEIREAFNSDLRMMLRDNKHLTGLFQLTLLEQLVDLSGAVKIIYDPAEGICLNQQADLKAQSAYKPFG